ncbi:SWIM zinc finger family protein [Verminephrobacter aporrectodeae subsp. tuberculatae]|nr:SWIM zinc finger family protein [Verminephrobacter aporrectodeae subsp. tuberculatae]
MGSARGSGSYAHGISFAQARAPSAGMALAPPFPENSRKNLRPMQLTAQSVLSLAPDEASAKAAKGLLAPGKWGSSLGSSERAVWGACQGSGAKPYQTQVDVTGAAPTFKCSCPSRKFPCKHGLALMLLRADCANLFASVQEPQWVCDWLDSRKERAQRKQDRTDAIALDPQAAAAAQAALAKREGERWKRIEAGADDLERFLMDRIAQGLATLERGNLEAWNQLAARMVDAQAPGLGELLCRAAAAVGVGPQWPAAVLALMGRMQLCIDALRHREDLPGHLVCDLQAALGWAADSDAALAQGERVEDTWLVVGCVVQERAQRLSERRVWLYGARSGRRALVLDFSHNGRGFETHWPLGCGVRTTLAFYPGASPLRALPCAAVEAAQTPAWPHLPSSGEWQLAANQLAANPFAPLSLVLLPKVAAARHEDRWWLHMLDGDPGRAVPLETRTDWAWDLLALTHGLPAQLAGEWDGQVLRPSCARSPEGFLTFADRIA